MSCRNIEIEKRLNHIKKKKPKKNKENQNNIIKTTRQSYARFTDGTQVKQKPKSITLAQNYFYENIFEPETQGRLDQD